jgi:hypothetical protein
MRRSGKYLMKNEATAATALTRTFIPKPAPTQDKSVSPFDIRLQSFD